MSEQPPALSRRQLLLQAGALAFAPALAGAAAAKRHIVTIEGMMFQPPRLAVSRGDRIDWVNKDLFPHTVTANGGAFDSHEIAAGASWSYVAGKAGEYAYRCTLHPTMAARLTVA